jgi:hypothetical protein
LNNGNYPTNVSFIQITHFLIGILLDTVIFMNHSIILDY